MRTRTLLLLAIACGVAILAAGVAQLLRVTNDDDPPRPASLGEEVAIGDLRVAVRGYTEESGIAEVTIDIGGVDDPGGIDRFRLVVPGEALAPLAVDGGGAVPACRVATEATQRCRLRFRLPADAGTSRRLLLRRGEEQVSWKLPAP